MRALVRGLRVGVKVVGWTVAGVLAVVLVALLVVQTNWAGEQIRKRVVAQANAQLQGRVQIGRVSLRGFAPVVDEVALFDPQGSPVLTVRRVHVALGWAALLRRTVAIRVVDVEGPRVALVQDEDGGSNLARALAPRTPKPPAANADEASGEPPHLTIRLEALHISDGDISVRQSGAAGAAGAAGDGPLANLRLTGLDLRAHGGYQMAPGSFDGAMEANARALSPVAGPLRVQVEAQGTAAEPRGELVVELAGAKIVARGQRTADTLDAELRTLAVPVRVACALGLGRGGACPLRAAVTANGEAHVQGTQARLSLAAHAGGARLTVNGHGAWKAAPGAPTDVTVESLRVQVSDLDASAVWAGAPPSRLAMLLEAQGGGHSLSTAHGSVRLHAPVGRLGAQTFGPLGLTAQVRPGLQGTLQAEGALPGGRVEAHATLDKGRLHGTSNLDLRSLEELTRSFAADERTAVKGRARIDVAVDGLVKLTRRSGENEPSGAEVDRLDARVQVAVPALTAQGLRVRDARLTAHLPSLPNPEGAQLDARIADLRSGTTPFGTVTAKLDALSGRQAHFAAAITQPQNVSVDARATFLGGPPRGDQVNLRLDQLVLAYPEGRWATTQPMTVLKTARELRVAGLRLANGGQSIALDLREAANRRDVHVVITGFDLGRLPSFVVGKRRLAGLIDMDAALDGPPRHPTLALKAQGKDLVMDRRQLGTLRIEAEDTRTEALGARLAWTPPETGLQPATIDVRTPFELGELMAGGHGLLDRLARETRPVRLRAHVVRMPVAVLGKLSGRDNVLRGGNISLEAELAGPALAPEGTVRLTADGVAGDGFPATDARIDLTFEKARAQLETNISRKQARLLAARATVGLPAPALRTKLDALMKQALTVDAEVGPLTMQRVDLPPKKRKRPPRALHGRATAKLTVRGTVGDPRIDLFAKTDQLAIDDDALGTGTLHATYDGKRGAVDLDLAGARNGRLRLSLAATPNQPLAAVLRDTPDPMKLPFTAGLDADAFDLAWLSGIVPTVPVVEGQLTANLAAKGPASAISFAGKADLTKGAVMVVGVGRYDGITLRVQGTERALVLNELTVGGSEGQLKFNGQLARGDDSKLVLDLSARAKTFLVRTEGQKIGTLTLDAHANGTIGPRRTKISPLAISELKFDVAKDRRKDLQSLDRPNDVVLVSDGKPLNKAQAKRLAALPINKEAGAATPGAPTKPAARPSTVRIDVKAPRNLWVRGDDLNLELGLSDDFRVLKEEETRVFGVVTVKRGFITVFGRRFDVTPDSTLTFGGRPDAPVFDVKANYKSVSEGVTVTVALSGDAKKPSFSLTSDPPHPETALVTLLVTGHLDLDRRAGATSAQGSSPAASIVTGALASQLQKTLAKRLPLDVLTIQPGQGPGTAFLEAGTYLTDELYVAYVGHLGADETRYQNRNMVHLEYQLTPRWSFDAEYGDARTGSADLVWKRHY